MHARIRYKTVDGEVVSWCLDHESFGDLVGDDSHEVVDVDLVDIPAGYLTYIYNPTTEALEGVEVLEPPLDARAEINNINERLTALEGAD